MQASLGFSVRWKLEGKLFDLFLKSLKENVLKEWKKSGAKSSDTVPDADFKLCAIYCFRVIRDYLKMTCGFHFITLSIVSFVEKKTVSTV